MTLLEWFADNDYIRCRDREEEKAFIQKVKRDEIIIHENIDCNFIDELLNDREFNSIIKYPVVYELTGAQKINTRYINDECKATAFFDIAFEDKAVVAINDLL